MTKEEEWLGTASPAKLIFMLAVPSVAAQFINVLYNIVDRMYIGHIPEEGAAALTGVGLTFPIITIISAFSAFAGAGGAPLAAIELGRERRDAAERILGTAAALLVCFAVVLTAVFWICKEPLLYVFGASSATIPYALEYLSVYLLGTIFVQLSLGLNMFITCQGHAKTAMLSVIIGAVLNIILDPIFIFLFDMGVTGAALATVISQAASAAWVILFLCSRRSAFKLRRRYFSLDVHQAARIVALGVSPFIMQATESLIVIVFNTQLQKYGGDLYVGSMTILQSLMQLVFVPVMGFTQGTQPIISFNYGAGKTDRVRQTVRIMLAVSLCITVAGWLAANLFPHVLVCIFTSDEELLAVSARMLPLFMGGVWIFGGQTACQSAFVGLGQAKISLFLALLRKVIILIPLAYVLPCFIGLTGIYLAEPAADITAAVTTMTLFALRFKKILAAPVKD